MCGCGVASLHAPLAENLNSYHMHVWRADAITTYGSTLQCKYATIIIIIIITRTNIITTRTRRIWCRRKLDFLRETGGNLKLSPHCDYVKLRDNLIISIFTIAADKINVFIYWLSFIVKINGFGNYHAVPLPWLTYVKRSKNISSSSKVFFSQVRPPFDDDSIECGKHHSGSFGFVIWLDDICRFSQLHFANGPWMNGIEQTVSQSVRQTDRRSHLNVSFLCFRWLDSFTAGSASDGLAGDRHTSVTTGNNIRLCYMNWLRSLLLRSPRCELIIWPEATW